MSGKPSRLESQSSSATEDQRRQLSAKKHTFTLVLSADYQMQKLVPYWGQSPQPGSTYYLQKLNHDTLGIVNHLTGASHVYLFDERTGPKTQITRFRICPITSQPSQHGCTTSTCSLAMRVVLTRTGTVWLGRGRWSSRNWTTSECRS